jgi:hypothetical protein
MEKARCIRRRSDSGVIWGHWEVFGAFKCENIT